MMKPDGPLLSSLSVELPPESNFRDQNRRDTDSATGHSKLTTGEIRETIEKARALGAEKITLLGEGPVAEPYLTDLLDCIRTLEMKAELSTCGSDITTNTARRLLDREVDIILAEPGRPGFDTALGHLLDAGYPTPAASLAVHETVSRNNMDELSALWQRARKNRITPIFEVRPPAGEDLDSSLPDPASIHALFTDLARFDEREYGIHWLPCPPVPGPSIPSFLLSPVLTPTGDIHPLKGVEISLGNIRKTALKNILKDSEVLENLSRWRLKIKGPCRTCEHFDPCFGSRALAWRITGDYMASDPTCWRNMDKNDRITYLPVPADRIIPQKSPMRLVSRLLVVKERYAEVEAVVDENSPFARADGNIEDAALFEMMAQAAAAMNGFEELDTGLPPHRGALLGGKNITLKGTGGIGETLRIKLTKKASFGSFGVIGATVESGRTLLAAGDIKVFKESL
ncbi:MAG: hypothetical protein K9J83_02170 [Desulfarculaceae bacterium]|nr:hypothetical protein [Desulfarculaceae bacterium]